MARRVGSARATNTCSAIASTSGGIEVAGQFAQLERPALGMAVVDLAVDGPLDPIRKTHDSLHRVATGRLPSYGNRMVASTVLPGRSPTSDPLVPAGMGPAVPGLPGRFRGRAGVRRR